MVNEINRNKLMTKEEAVHIAKSYLDHECNYPVFYTSADYFPASEPDNDLRDKWIIRFNIDLGEDVLASTALAIVAIDPHTGIANWLRNN